SGSASFKAAGSSSACALATDGAKSRTPSATAAADRRVMCCVTTGSYRMMFDWLARSADGDPPPDDQNLTVREIGRTVVRHPASGDACRAFEFLNQITIVWIAWDDTDGAGLSPDGRVDELIECDVVVQVHPTRRRATGARVTLGACRTSRSISRFEDVALDGRERGFERRRGSGHRGQLLITSGPDTD